VPPFKPAWDWGESLAENLLQPHNHISNWEAFGRRLRRNYIWIYLIIGASWAAKLWLHPVPASSWQEAIQRADFLNIPGLFLFLIVGGFLTAMAFIAILTRPLQEASGEILRRDESAECGEVKAEADAMLKNREGIKAWFRPEGKRDQNLIHIITSKPDQISREILVQMNRGVTQIEGRGKYTDSEKTVLMIALTVTEIPSLKEIIREVDPKAFVIVSPAQDIMGGGFSPIER